MGLLAIGAGHALRRSYTPWVTTNDLHIERAAHLIWERSDDVAALMAEHPPRFRDANKQAVQALSAAAHAGTMRTTRWRPWIPRLQPGTPRPALVIAEDVFDYPPSSDGAVHWTMNFAHHDLFCAYGGRLLAQDELQVVEHPALGALREALLAERRQPFTVEGGAPTPILIAGVPRRFALDTAGLYGNRFTRARREVVEAATTVLDPPTTSNILAMEAPFGRHGAYTREDLSFILQTAFSGYRAACLESAGRPVVLHTGFWGCGAYGGDRQLMVLLQLIAAHAAGVDRVVFHTFDRAGAWVCEDARHRWEHTQAGTVQEWIEALLALGFVWGVGDGT